MLFTSHRNGYSNRLACKQRSTIGNPKLSAYKYRLYADGTIYDQELNRVVGLITKDLDEVYALRGRALQKYLREYLAS